MEKITDENLQMLIRGLRQSYIEEGVSDPWILPTGEMIHPIDVLLELQELRTKQKPAEAS